MPDTPDNLPQITGETGPAADPGGWPGAGGAEGGAGASPLSRRDDLGRFVRGTSGNPAGRPPGSKASAYRAGTRTAVRLLDEHAEILARKAIELAMEGDAVAVRFCLGRILGTRRGQPVEIDLPAIAEPADLGAEGPSEAARPLS